ncbi:MAG TPA: (d)CMP kinase [Thermoanaerobaculia bacterium]|nr:(d)CMP kinase [Thermoanaerobaculia bacterium]
MTPPVVAIDGPAGVGKSTVTRKLAERLGLPYLDTGAMYRAVALAASRRGVDAEDETAVDELAAGTDLALELGADGHAAILLDGVSVAPHIRSQEIGELASRLAACSPVRRRLVGLQREFGRAHGAVLEGRDIGSVVFPETPWKFFLDARPEVRVQRRLEQLRRQGRPADRRQVAREVAARDARDSQRADSPLRRDAGSVVVDTSELSPQEVVERLVELIDDPGS